MKTLRSAWIRTVILICTSAQLLYYTRKYVGYMFRLINSHLQAYSLQVKLQDAVHTFGSRCVYISEIFKPYHLPRRVKLAKYVTNKLVTYFASFEVQISITKQSSGFESMWSTLYCTSRVHRPISKYSQIFDGACITKCNENPTRGSRVLPCRREGRQDGVNIDL